MVLGTLCAPLRTQRQWQVYPDPDSPAPADLVPVQLPVNEAGLTLQGSILNTPWASKYEQEGNVSPLENDSVTTVLILRNSGKKNDEYRD